MNPWNCMQSLLLNTGIWAFPRKGLIGWWKRGSYRCSHPQNITHFRCSSLRFIFYIAEVDFIFLMSSEPASRSCLRPQAKNSAVIWLKNSSWMGVLTAVPERWHLADIHSKSVMKHRRNAVPLSPKEKMAGVCVSLFGRKFSFSAGPRGWAVTKYCLAPHPLADSQVSERQIRHFPVLDPGLDRQGWLLTVLKEAGNLPGLPQLHQSCHSL